MYFASEGGFLMGATYNYIALGTSYGTTYSEAHPMLNLAELMLPGSNFFFNKDSYQTIDYLVNNPREREVEIHVEGVKCDKK